MKLPNKVVLITGGANGIGKATVQAFAQEGAKVACCDLDEARGQAFIQELGEAHMFSKVDVVSRPAVQAWVDAVFAKYGRIDVLINNAGVTRDCQLVKMHDGKVIKQMSVEDFDLVMAVNVKGTFNCSQAVAPYMIQGKGGVIVSASSVIGLYGNFGQTNYVASKSAVVGMSKVWARELGKYNIRVNSVSPGFVATDMVAKMPEKVLDEMRKKTPLGRLGKPEEIAQVYLWLASDDASFITGANISADGGIVIGT